LMQKLEKLRNGMPPGPDTLLTTFVISVCSSAKAINT